jgi:hypothetical protein
MARPQVAFGEITSDIKGSYEYGEYEVADSRQRVVFQLWGSAWSSVLLTIEEEHVMKCYTGPRIYTDSVERPTQWKVDMIFGTYIVRILSLGQAN